MKPNTSTIEANKYIQEALLLINAGDYNNAKLLLHKAKKVDANADVNYLYKLIYNLSLRTIKQGSHGHPHYPIQNLSSDPLNRDMSTEYTIDQLKLVSKILSCKNSYLILQVNRNATFAEIKKSYKKLALLLHPDKNRAPGASAAFQAISNAFYKLAETTQSDTLNQRRGNQNNISRNFQNVTRDHYFFPSFRFHYQRQPQDVTDINAENKVSTYILIVLLVLIFGATLFSILTKEKEFSLTKSREYSKSFKSENLFVLFYMKPLIRGATATLQKEVEYKFMSKLQIKCNLERLSGNSIKSNLTLRGRAQFYEIKKLKTPSCDIFMRKAVALFSFL